jgi:hypothetical protein
VLGAPPRTAQSSQTPKLYIANVKCDKSISRNRLIPMIADEKLGTRVHGLIFFFFVSLFIELSSNHQRRARFTISE